MNDTPSPDDETFPYWMNDRIDQICDKYESELRTGSQPIIELYVTLVEASVRKRLVKNLVAIDFEFHQQLSQGDFDSYYRRLPEWSELLQQLAQELNLPPRKPNDQPDIELSGDDTVKFADVTPELTHFELLNVAGSGGFGTVWRAMDRRLQREVAVKIPRSDRTNRVDLHAITREAQVAAKLRHPNIVSVHEVGEEGSVSFIVTDFIDGMNLKEWKKKHNINAFDAARLVAKLAIAIQYAHSQGVIHRDLKLANVLMDANGEPHVADFGLAKREARDDSLAIDGQVIGTPAYMAPEQARADHDSIDARTDVYSLGVILYELITGSTPFRGDVPHLLQQILDAPPATPRSLKPDIPKDLDGICLKCLSKENSKRYATAQALADDLYLFLNGETLRGIPAALPNRVWKWFRRNRRIVAMISFVAILVGSVSTGFMAWRHHNSPPTVPRSLVEFTTDPPGSEITVVTLDPETGEPDPTKIQTAAGRTPLTMFLAAGDYLVVAVLKNRFTEVYRHVPDKNEALAFKPPHLTWKRRPNDVIELTSIPIPRPDISNVMAFIESTDRLVEPERKHDGSIRAWRVPAFFVDSTPVLSSDLEKSSLAFRLMQHNGPGQFATLSFDRALWYLETIGKRLPSAAEAYYLSTIACKDEVQGDDGEPLCKLADQTLIEGIRSDPWEWTSTKPGGPFSGCAPIKSLGLEFQSRMIFGGKPTTIGITPTGLFPQRELPRSGFRGVRSAAPRRKAEDFVVPAIAAKTK